MSQFSEIMEAITGVKRTLVTIHRDVMDLTAEIRALRGLPIDRDSFEAGLNEDLELEDDSEGERIIHIEDPGVPRRMVPYKTKDGGDSLYDSNLLEKKIKEVMAIAKRRRDPWQLYENPDGTMRIMVSGETVAEWNAQHPGSGVGER